LLVACLHRGGDDVVEHVCDEIVAIGADARGLLPGRIVMA
jgi:hypothetical protein